MTTHDFITIYMNCTKTGGHELDRPLIPFMGFTEAWPWLSLFLLLYVEEA